MDIFSYMNTVLSSYWGMYAVQTVLHSIIASVLVDCAFMAWDIQMPCMKQRFRFMVIFLPLVMFPLYQWVSPRRGDVYFRLNSLTDSTKWFSLDPGGVPVFVIFALILLGSTLIFIIQELLPIFLHMREQRLVTDEPEEEEGPIDDALVQKVSKALDGLPVDKKLVEIINDDDLVLFSDTGLNPMIYVSTGLAQAFTSEHLRAAFAHEIGHIQRTRKPVLIFAYILRVIMFYNPIAMLEFRRLAQEEEKVCDDIAISLTGNPEALSEAVDMFRPEPEGTNPGAGAGKIAEIASSLEQRSHDSLLRSRISRIGEGRRDDCHWGIPYVATMAIIIVINFYVV